MNLYQDYIDGLVMKIKHYRNEKAQSIDRPMDRHKYATHENTYFDALVEFYESSVNTGQLPEIRNYVEKQITLLRPQWADSYFHNESNVSQ